MTKEKLRIVFMGTPDFAVASLQALVEGGYTVVGVVTTPDKPVGRHGSVTRPSAVKEYALQQKLPILQPEKLKDESFIEELRRLQADLQIVVAFRMLPEVVWNMPRMGTFNLHASLLPQYRGAAPINWAIINGEKETGITTFFLTREIDTGRIIRQTRIPIAETDNAQTVHDTLMTKGAILVTDTVDMLISTDGRVATISQETCYTNEDKLYPAPKIFTETCRINWEQPVERIYNFIRGLSPYPAAWTDIIRHNKSPLSVKIFESEKRHKNHNLPTGAIRTDGKQYIEIAATDGFIRIISLQPAGKKRMTAKEFLNGAQIGKTFQ